MATRSSPLSEPSDFAYAPGDVIAGKYALEELLGAGGMGAVFRARNTTIDMPVAIKVIRSDMDREILSGRLLQEARASARLAHPAIVRVFDVGQTALGDPFIVMELLHGETLAAVIDREGRLSGARAVQLLLPIADALSVAHAKGLVHRDVKPDNVFIAQDEEGQLQPKLVDFGIVKLEQKGSDSQLTQVGAVLGSPDYMSPEQARGLDGIDLRSDVWSFSVVLYEAIVGQAPFQSQNYNALLRLIVETEPTSLSQLAASDDELSAIVARGMEKHPDARFASMSQMGVALASWLWAQGFSEDACGVSLEARWLSRTSDPSFSGRVSRSSHPDSWPEPPSGMRAIARRADSTPSGQLGTAPTVAVSRPAGTPVPPAQSSAGPGSARRLYWAGAAALGLLALAAWGWFGRSQSSAAAERPEPLSRAATAEPQAEPAAPAPSNASPTAPPSGEQAVSPERPAASPSSAALAAAADSRRGAADAPRAPTRAQVGSKAQPPSPAPRARPPKSAARSSEAATKPAPAAPASDLIAPY